MLHEYSDISNYGFLTHFEKGGGAFFSRVRQGSCYKTGSRELFVLRQAHQLINLWNLQGISLSLLGGRGQGEGVGNGR